MGVMIPMGVMVPMGVMIPMGVMVPMGVMIPMGVIEAVIASYFGSSNQIIIDIPIQNVIKSNRTSTRHLITSASR
jgi:invasion protein IalB